MTPLLEVRSVGKRFGATQALQQVTLAVHSGEVLALIGENGAGKSTLMKLLSGVYQPDEGNMFLAGKPFAPQGPVDSLRSGIAMIYQELNLAKHLSVEENIMLGQEHHVFGWVNRGKHRTRVREVLELLGHPDLSSSRQVGQLSIGAQQLVEIARALVAKPSVMIFDEPTSSLPRKDVERLFVIIDRLRDQGMAVIYISHFLEELRRVANRFVVLRDGRSVATGQLDQTNDSQIVSMMAGRSVEAIYPQIAHNLGEPVLKIDRLSGPSVPKDISFQVRRGEIFGLFGLVGAGRTETLRQLFGLDASNSGRIIWQNRPMRPSPRRSIANRIGFLSEDRKTEGLAQDLSINDNLTLSRLTPYSRIGLLNLKKRKAAVANWMGQLGVKATGSEQPVNYLSGGNQQKIAMARVLHQEAELLLFDEPTRGIDVRTKADIYQLLGELASQGKTIVFVSSYLPELLAICDTIGVMARGRLRAVRSANEWTDHEILAEAMVNESGEESGESDQI